MARRVHPAAPAAALARYHEGRWTYRVQGPNEPGVWPVALTTADVSRLAKLARIDLTDAELAHLGPQLDVILESVASVASLATADVAPMSHPLPLANVMRPDVVQPSLTPAEVLAGAPAAQDQMFRVPRILDEQ